jgi:hypothetical protein
MFCVLAVGFVPWFTHAIPNLVGAGRPFFPWNHND